jgi:pimeloyl-ACP methyl ester carboxylesterase
MNESARLAEAVARAWSSGYPAAEDRARVQPALLAGLRRLELASPPDGGPARDEILTVIATAPELAEAVRSELEQVEASETEPDERGTDERGTDVGQPARHVRQCLVEVMYATDRRPAQRQAFGGERGELTVGAAAVTLADDPRMGQLPKPRPWFLRFGRDQRGSLRLMDLAGSGDPVGWTRELADRLQRTPEPDVLVFVHGYNVSFDDAVRRTAQIAYDLDFKGVPFLYSWPSEGATLRYLVDSDNAEWSWEHFVTLLRGLLVDAGARRVHVVAHSMGNRLLTMALTALDTSILPPGAGRLGQIVFAAPMSTRPCSPSGPADGSGTPSGSRCTSPIGTSPSTRRDGWPGTREPARVGRTCWSWTGSTRSTPASWTPDC